MKKSIWGPGLKKDTMTSCNKVAQTMPKPFVLICIVRVMQINSTHDGRQSFNNASINQNPDFETFFRGHAALASGKRTASARG